MVKEVYKFGFLCLQGWASFYIPMWDWKKKIKYGKRYMQIWVAFLAGVSFFPHAGSLYLWDSDRWVLMGLGRKKKKKNYGFRPMPSLSIIHKGLAKRLDRHTKGVFRS